MESRVPALRCVRSVEGAHTFATHEGMAGSTIWATGRVPRETKSMVFVQGHLEQNDRPILAFSSVSKKLAPR